jgi:hypothetical protein
MAGHVQLRRYRKHPRGPKKPPPTRTGSYQHVSNKRLLDQRKCYAGACQGLWSLGCLSGGGCVAT